MSRYDVFRRRIAPIAFALGLGLLVHDSCEKSKRTHTNVELTFGASAPEVRGVEVDIVVGDEIIATFRRAALPGAGIGLVRFPATLTKEVGELRIDIDLGSRHERLTRRFQAIEGATLTVPLLDAAK